MFLSVNFKTYLSTSVLMTANVSNTRPSTFCFLRRGSCGPLPLRGGLTGSLGRLLRASPTSVPAVVPWSTRLDCPRDARVDPWWWSSKSLSSRHTQLFPMDVVARVPQRLVKEFEEERRSRTCARLLQAQKVIQAATIISFGKMDLEGCFSQSTGRGQNMKSCCYEIKR